MIRFHGMRIGAYEVRVALLLSAGFWQLRRAEEKRTIALEQADRGGKQTVVLEPALAASASLEQLRHRRARAAGHYRGDVQYLLDNRIQNRAAGYHVLTPFRLQGSDVHLLVNRGWLPVGPDRGRLPAVTVSDKAVVQEGLIVAPPASGLALGASGYDGEGWPRVVQRVDLVRIREQLKRPLLPFVLRLSPASDHGYERDWRVRTGLTPERHLGYAVRWFALAVALVGLCVWVAVKRVQEEYRGL
jgi:surfeit locus 1 family protein